MLAEARTLRRAAGLGAVAAALLLASAGAAPAQAPAPPPRPSDPGEQAPVELGQPMPVPDAATPTPPSPPGLSYIPPPPPAPPSPAPPAVPEPEGWGPYGPPGGQQGGFYFLHEVEFLRPVLRHGVGSGGTVADNATLPSASLGWTVAPWFELGYRFDDRPGYLALGYRFLSTDGTTPVSVDGLDSQVRSRFSINMIDLDYGTLPYGFAPFWDVAGRFGIRAVDTFFQTQLQNAAEFQQVSDVFYGAGPHGRVDLRRHVGLLPGLAFLGRLDGAIAFGQLDQHYNTNGILPGATMLSTGTISQQRLQNVPIAILQAGIEYRPARWQWLHFIAGYQYEHWWYVGRIGNDMANGNFAHTKGEFGAQGIFIRGQADF